MTSLDEERKRKFRKLLDDYLEADALVKQLLPAMTQPFGTEIPDPVRLSPDDAKRCLEAMDARREADQRLRDFLREWFATS